MKKSAENRPLCPGLPYHPKTQTDNIISRLCTFTLSNPFKVSANIISKLEPTITTAYMSLSLMVDSAKKVHQLSQARPSKHTTAGMSCLVKMANYYLSAYSKEVTTSNQVVDIDGLDI